MQKTGLITTGIPVFVNDNMCQFLDYVQIKFPKSKKKCIRKKWEKQHKNWAMKKKERIIKFEDKIIVSSKTFEMLKSSL